MRPSASLVLVAFAALAAATATPVFAQQGGGPGGGGGGGGGSADDDAKARKRNEEWGTTGANLPLPELRNAGPCPFVKVLYDAARYVELKDNKESPSAVGYTGEIENLASACEYKSDDPIKVQARLLFGLGRGPQADGYHKTYRYWVAVTDRNHSVLAKQYFTLHAVFPAGEDRILMTDRINNIVIPRANTTVSGGNFEVLVGFDVTPDMADFNEQGKRFRVNAVPATTASVQAPPAQQ